MTTKLPPGPKSAMLGLDYAQKFRKDPLGVASALHEQFGDAVYLKMGPIDYFLMNHPDFVKEVLVSRPKDFVKSDQFKRIITSVDGNGLVASEGEFWQKQRRTINPTFGHDKLRAYTDVIEQIASKHFADWRPGSVLEIHREMTRVTLKVAAKIFLGVDVSGREDELAAAVDSISQIMYKEFTDFIPLPEWVPTPSKLEKRHAVEIEEKLIREGIAEQRDKPVEGSMLSSLLRARDTEDGSASGMPEEQVIAEAKTMFNAGHDSTAAALAWCWYLLLSHPDIYDRVIEETDASCAEGAVTYEALAKATYVVQVAKEALRLYPPAWVIPRQVAEATQLGGFDLPKGAFVNVFPWVIQRDQRFFPNPDKFDPERFSAENEPHIPHFAWFPFGAGGRACIGKDLALLEMQMLIMMVSRKFRLQFAQGQDARVVPHPLISLEPFGGIKVQVNVR